MVIEQTATSTSQSHDAATVALAGLLIVQRGQRILFTALPPRDVIRHRKVDEYDYDRNPDGYQRDAVKARIKKVGEYYLGSDERQPGLMPNPLLGNIRAEDLSKVDVRITPEEAQAYEAAISNNSNWTGLAHVHVPRDLSIWIYDGQHRIGGLERVMGLIGEMPIPLSVTLGLPRDGEMKEFFEVNSNAKPVKTDLAFELLRHMAVDDPQVAAYLESTGRDWTVRGVEVAHELLEFSRVWQESLQLPNRRKKRDDRLTITQAQFVKSLKPVLDMPLLQKANTATIASVIDAYWSGIGQVLPELFAAANSPKDYVIQKGAGVTALHRVLPYAVETLRARARRLADPDAYAEVMARLPDLSGEVFDEEGDSTTVTGSDFWRSGSSGAAGQFTGEAGYRRLGLRIQALMPKPSDEINL